MDKLGIKIEYIFNSGFTVETKNHFLIFDYYKGDISFSDKKTTVFVSHGHGDHYNPEIFNFEGNIDYVISDDLKVEQKVNYVKPGSELKLNDINIKVFGSTDLGVSFLISVDDLNIFHAGDLNWWYWENDSDKEKSDMEKQFKNEIDKIKGHDIDLAFFPVDPRLGEAFSKGGEYFIDAISPKYFVPMHFGDNYDATTNFTHKMKGSSCTISEIKNKNQVISI